MRDVPTRLLQQKNPPGRIPKKRKNMTQKKKRLGSNKMNMEVSSLTGIKSLVSSISDCVIIEKEILYLFLDPSILDKKIQVLLY